MTKRIIVVCPYSKNWPELFNREAELLSQCFGENAIQVDHIGSTSVPELAAKPIIDILVEVKSLQLVDTCGSSLAAIGYKAKGENGITGRRYFQKGGNQRSHHVHVFQSGDDHLIRHRAFKHYLIAHSEIAQQYAQIKQTAVQQCNNSIEQYMALKNHFIEEHEPKAVNWFTSQHF